MRQSSWIRGPPFPKSNTYTENLSVNATGINRKEMYLTQGSLYTRAISTRQKREKTHLAESRREGAKGTDGSRGRSRSSRDRRPKQETENGLEFR